MWPPHMTERHVWTSTSANDIIEIEHFAGVREVSGVSFKRK